MGLRTRDRQRVRSSLLHVFWTGGTSMSFALASLIFTFASARVHGQEAEPDCYKRGDANSDGQVSLTDASLIIDFLFYNPNGVMPFACELAANVGGPDIDGTMNINIADPNLVISSLFLTGTQSYEIPPRSVRRSFLASNS
jgi:hypothetical protein